MRRLTVILTAALVAAAASAQLQWKETAWDFGIINEAMARWLTGLPIATAGPTRWW